MTKFGKHPDKDTVDLAAEAAMGALADGGVTMKDMGVLAAGNLMGGRGGIGQQLQKQIGQTGIPVYNVANACATGATALRTAIMAVKAGECDMGLAVGVEKLAGAGLLAGGARKDDGDDVDAAGPLRRGRPGRRSHRHRDHARRVRPDRHGVRPPLRRHELRAVRPDPREEPRALDAQPAGRLHQEDVARADHGRRDDRLPEHPADVLGQLRRRRRRGRGQRREAARRSSLEQQRRAVKVSASVLTTDPWEEACQVLPERQHPHPQRRQAGLRAGRRRPGGPRPGRAARLLRHRRARALRQPHAVRGGRRGRLLRVGRDRGATARRRSTCRAGCESKGHPIAATGIANIWEVCHHLRGEAGDRQIEGAKVGLAHVIGLGSACGVHILERAAA